ncbi:MAG TPA: DUF4129 domain-containing protein [Humibacter sp.]|nr:DUF4129 domain-containing protein [Humibacter sp.]
MTSFHPILSGVRLAAPPLTPDGPTAQHWLHQELAKPEYQAAKPTWFDRLAQQISDWFSSLGFHVGSGAGWIIAAVGIALVAALIIGAFAIFGLPRLRRRRTAAVLFDDDDPRGVQELRRDAAASARDGRYDAAVLDLFRAISRALAERTIVIVLPGTTAQEVAVLAAVAMPEFAGRLHESALLFDGVRYLGRAAGPEDYAGLKSLDDDLRAARPRLDGLIVDAMSLDALSLDATSSTADPIGSGRAR